METITVIISIFGGSILMADWFSGGELHRAFWKDIKRIIS